jgi:DNA-binding LacI/PurR family transcriptional regulator
MVTAGATMAAGARAFDALPRGRQRPTAVLSMSDMAAIGVMSAAHSAGVNVPEDLSVVGYDDVPMAAYTSPALTTVHQPIVEKGRVAVRLLIQRLQGKAIDSPPPLKTRLVVRASTARAGARANKEVVGDTG